MDIYPLMLKSACETWFKIHYTGAYHSSLRIEHNLQTSARPAGKVSEQPELQLKVPAGPWPRVYVWFKSPGVVLSPAERESMNGLRNQGYRVAIVRHMEDFKTLIGTLIHPTRQALQ
jgi:hypothetical protein